MPTLPSYLSFAAANAQWKVDSDQADLDSLWGLRLIHFRQLAIRYLTIPSIVETAASEVRMSEPSALRYATEEQYKAFVFVLDVITFDSRARSVFQSICC